MDDITYNAVGGSVGGGIAEKLERARKGKIVLT